MGRLTPNRPQVPAPTPPPCTTARPQVPLRRCAYCARFNAGTSCDGCGAPVDWSQPQVATVVVSPFPNVRR